MDVKLLSIQEDQTEMFILGVVAMVANIHTTRPLYSLRQPHTRRPTSVKAKPLDANNDDKQTIESEFEAMSLATLKAKFERVGMSITRLNMDSLYQKLQSQFKLSQENVDALQYESKLFWNSYNSAPYKETVGRVRKYLEREISTAAIVDVIAELVLTNVYEKTTTGYDALEKECLAILRSQLNNSDQITESKFNVAMNRGLENKFRSIKAEMPQLNEKTLEVLYTKLNWAAVEYLSLKAKLFWSSPVSDVHVPLAKYLYKSLNDKNLSFEIIADLVLTGKYEGDKVVFLYKDCKEALGLQ